MVHRSDLEAAHARIAALERELASARKQNRQPFRCGRCRRAFEAADVDVASNRIRCRGCGIEVQLGEARATRLRGQEDLTILATDDRLHIEWRRGGVGVMTASAILFAVLTVAGLFLKNLFVIGVGALLTVLGIYTAVASARNRTTVEVTGTGTSSTLSIRNGPVPSALPVELHGSQIEQLYCTMKRGRYGVSFALRAHVRGGAERELLDGLRDLSQALFLERTLEKRLGITDREVDGEVARR